MKAIVLSFDQQSHFAELTYRMYMELWPDCPFTFKIPWNNHKRSYLEKQKNVELVQCDKPIGSTMCSLLQDCDDEEWVYWCIDDRFPVSLNVTRFKNVYDHLEACAEYDFVKPFHVGEFNQYTYPEPLQHVNLIENEKLIAVQNFNYHIGFWIHHFMKAKILKHLFMNNSSDIDFYQNLIKDDNILKPYRGLFFEKESKIINFLEPVIDGVVTKHGQEYTRRLNLT